MRVGQGFFQRLDDGAATIDPADPLFPIGGGTRGDQRGHRRRRPVGIDAVVAPFPGELDRFDERFPELLFQRCRRQHLPVGRRIKAVTGRSPGDQIAAVGRPEPRRLRVADRPEHEGKEVVRHRDVERRPLARPVPLAQRQQDIEDCGVGTGRDIRHQHRRHHGAIPGAHREGKHPGFADIVEVVGGDVALRTRLAETGDRAVDDPGIDLPHRLRIQPEARHHARAELLDEDVGAFEERSEPRLVGLLLEVEHERLLAPVEHREVDALPAPSRHVAAHFLAARPFDLDDLGARLREHQGRHRTRQQGGKVEDQDAVERGRHRRSDRSLATTAARAGASPGWPLWANSALETS